MQIIYKQDVIKSEPRNAQGRRALEVRRTKYKDYAEIKRNEREAKRIERETRRRDKIPLNNDQPEVCCMRKILLPKDEEKYLRMKSKYWNVCWLMKRFQAIYMMRQLLGAEWDKKRLNKQVILDLIYVLPCYHIYKNEILQFLQNRQSKHQLFFT
ncbi:hypothetical protein GLOIN_2v1813984 [Rhizophagus irregularis DAOM 181602=DAOM 197198]|nr:hypothetical protein GLOIN_2v1813984 [Rhizophagus irregularis DAOM 181602=DAOM 197198]